MSAAVVRDYLPADRDLLVADAGGESSSLRRQGPNVACVSLC